MSRRFFFYGTLIAGSENAVARAVHARLRPLGRATAAGCLHAVPDEAGWYPALVDGDGTVAGAVYEALPTFDAADLAALDAYEGTDYERRIIMIDGFGAVEAYWWTALLPPGAQPIDGGDFAQWLATTGASAFTGQ